MNTTQEITTFANRQQAQELVDQLDNATYHLAHGEYARPDYTARKVRGKDRYYIYAKRYYYAGTIGAVPSGPLTRLRIDGLVSRPYGFIYSDHPIDRCLEEIEDAKAELEELNECGDLEERLEKAYEIEELESKLTRLRIDGHL